MSLDVEIALIANPAAPFEPGPIDAFFYAQPYKERTRVALQVEPEESLASVLERAAAAFELRAPSNHWMSGHFDATHRKVAFYQADDDLGPIRRSKGRLLLGELTLVDQNGHAIFGVHDLSTVRFADLLRSAQAGTIEGDPLRPYLILDDGWGDAPPVDWATVQAGLELAWEVVNATAVAAGATAGVVKGKKWLLERLGRGRKALQANQEWAQRGYRPDQFDSLVLTREWRTRDLARLLGCTEEQAEGALWVLGYVFNDAEGVWKFDDGEAGIMFKAIITAIGRAAHTGGDWRPRFQAWMKQTVDEGKPASLEALDSDFSDAPAPQWKPTIGERIDRWLVRFHGPWTRQ